MDDSYSEEYSSLEISDEIFRQYDRRVNKEYQPPRKIHAISMGYQPPISDFNRFYEQYKLHAKFLKHKEQLAKELWGESESQKWPTDHFYMYHLLNDKIIFEDYIDTPKDSHRVLKKFKHNHMMLVYDGKDGVNMFINDNNEIIEILGIDQMVQETHLGYMHKLLLNMLPVEIVLIRLNGFNPKRLVKIIRKLYKNNTSNECNLL